MPATPGLDSRQLCAASLSRRSPANPAKAGRAQQKAQLGLAKPGLSLALESDQLGLAKPGLRQGPSSRPIIKALADSGRPSLGPRTSGASLACSLSRPPGSHIRVCAPSSSTSGFGKARDSQRCFESTQNKARGRQQRPEPRLLCPGPSPATALVDQRERTPQAQAASAEMAAEASKKHLVVVGSANADIYLEIQRLPLKGETISASGGKTLPGGKGANQAACGARLGLPTYFLGQLGQDAYAALLESALQESGVNTTELRRIAGGVPTGHAVVMLQPDGANSIIIVGGANAAWDNESGSFFSEEGSRLLQSAGAVLLQREIPDEVNLEAAKIAHSAGVPVVLDVGGVEGPISDDLLRCLTVLSPNETELLRLTGMPTDTETQIKGAAQQLLDKGVPHVLVKLGSDGSLLLSSQGQGQTGRSAPAEIRQLCVPAPEVVDTTGAGDTFTAAFAVGLVEGMSHAQAVKFASCAASLTVRRKGAMPSLPYRGDVDSLYRSECS